MKVKRKKNKRWSKWTRGKRGVPRPHTGRFTHLSGHPSDAGQTQDRGVRRRNTNVLPLCYTTNHAIQIYKKYTIWETHPFCCITYRQKLRRYNGHIMRRCSKVQHIFKSLSYTLVIFSFILPQGCRNGLLKTKVYSIFCTKTKKNTTKSAHFRFIRFLLVVFYIYAIVCTWCGRGEVYEIVFVNFWVIILCLIFVHWKPKKRFF